MVLYIENPTDAARKLLELINESGNIVGYKIHTQKSLAFLYTNNKRSKRGIQEIIPFTITSKRVKHTQGINVSKKAKDLYPQNYKMWQKK